VTHPDSRPVSIESNPGKRPFGPLSTPRLDFDPDYRGKKSDIGQNFHLNHLGWLTVYPRAFSLDFQLRVVAFLAACLLKTANPSLRLKRY
jgi:hypothetical protein